MIIFRDLPIQKTDLLVSPQKYVTPRRLSVDKTKTHPIAVIGSVFIFWG